MATSQQVKPLQENTQKSGVITLKGSAALVGDYLRKSSIWSFCFHTLNIGVSPTLDCAINSILYMRGVYPADMFEGVQKYGMCIFDAKDDELKGYLNQALKWARG